MKTFPSLHIIKNRDYTSTDGKGPVAYKGNSDEANIFKFIDKELELFGIKYVKEDL